MFVLTHAAIGALIASALPTHPWIVFFLSVFAHFFMDAIPHGDSELYKHYIAGRISWITRLYLASDILLTTCFSFFLFYHASTTSLPTLIAGLLGSILPDVLVGIYEFFRVRGLFIFHRFHFFFHNFITSRWRDLPLWLGLPLELLLIIGLCTRIF